MSAEDGSATAAEVRLAAYLMTGSLRYAQALADDVQAEGAAGATAGGREAPVIAVARCHDDVASRPSRTLPLWATAAAGNEPSPVAWLEPFPDDLYPESLEPAGRFEPRETIDLDFVAALQRLSPPERGLVILHDVLGLAEPDGDASIGLAAARAALASARAPFDGPAPPSGDESIAMMRFVFSCESADGAGLRALLAPGAVLQSVPDGAVHTGRDAVADQLLPPETGASSGAGPAARAVPAARAGLQRLLPRRANGRLAFGVYRRASRDEPFRADALYIVALDGPAVAGVVSFSTPSLFSDFALLPELSAQGERPRAGP